MSTAMSFCPECSNLLYPREDPERRQLMFLCRQCDFARYANKDDREENCVDRQNFNYKSKEDIYISADLAKDPTLGRIPHWRCRKCRHRGAVFYQLPERVAEDAMALVYVCLTPGCGEIEIQMPSSSSSSSSSSTFSFSSSSTFSSSSSSSSSSFSPSSSSSSSHDGVTSPPSSSSSSQGQPPSHVADGLFMGLPKREEGGEAEVPSDHHYKEEKEQQRFADSSEGTQHPDAYPAVSAASNDDARIKSGAEAASLGVDSIPVGGGVAAFFAKEEETAPGVAAEEEEEEEEEEQEEEEDLFGEGSDDPGENYAVAPPLEPKTAEDNMYLGAEATAVGGPDREAQDEEEETFYTDPLNNRRQQPHGEEDEEEEEQEQPEEEEEDEEDEDEEDVLDESHSNPL